jgi:hypothetical protein
VRFDYKLDGIGTIYGIFEVAFLVHTEEDRKVDVGTSYSGFTYNYKWTAADIALAASAGIFLPSSYSLGGFGDDGFKVGIETDFGIYGYVQPELLFSLNGESPDDVLQFFNIRAGYKTGPIDAYATFSIPTFEDGMKWLGLTITPHVEYEIISGLSAYLELEFSGLGSDSDVGSDFGFTPTIGVSYSF